MLGLQVLDMRSPTGDVQIKKNQLISTIPYIGKEFVVSFNLVFWDFPSNMYESVLHMTRGGNAGVLGDRIPAIWVTSGQKLHVASAIDSTVNKWYDISGIRKQAFNKVTVQQLLNNGKVWLVFPTQ